MLRKLRLRLRALLHRNDISDELADHLHQLTDEFIAHGLSPQEARSAALRQFGNTTRIQERSHDLFSFRLIEDLLQDLRYGQRSIRRNPSVAVAAVLSMGLAIGVNTVVFSLIQEIFFARPTTRNAGDLVSISLRGSSHASLPNLRDLDASGSLERVAGYDIEATVNWRNGNSVQRTPVMLVSENYFELLEPRPAVGRTFQSGEARAERNPHIAVITHRLWSRTFHEDPGIIGRSLVLNGRPYTVLGVLPEGFRPPTMLNVLPDLYLPASAELKPSLLQRQSYALILFGRRKDGQSIDQARAALEVALSRMEQDHPKENARLSRSLRLRPLTGLDPDLAPLVKFAALLSAVVFVVLWIACVNVAAVLIARSAARRREIATRLAIGAGRGRLIRQLLAESLLLSSIGTVAGLTLHWYLTGLLNRFTLPLPFPVTLQITPDFTLVLYAIALTVIAALFAGLLPAWQATRPGLTAGLKTEEPQYGYRRFTLRNGLVVGQVAITCVLLTVAVLFARSLARVHSMNPGFDLQHTVWARVSVLSDRYPKEQAYTFATHLLEAASNTPGVRSAALVEVVPFNSAMRIGTQIQTNSGPVRAEYFNNNVGPGYFETIGMPLISGRPFAATDRQGSPHVVILNEALARRLFGHRPAVGEHIWFGDKKEGPGVEVVGVSANAKHLTMGEDQVFAIYEPIARNQPQKSEIHVLVRAAGDPTAIVGSLRDALSALDDTAAVDVAPLKTRLAFAYLPAQIGAALVGILGLIGLALALIGIYGTMTFAVSRRTAEIGIRTALGASRAQVLRSILGTALAAMCVGLVVGLSLAVFAAQPLAMFLAEGITPMDPVSFASVIVICLLTGAIAALVPARRALSIDPTRALRVE